MLCIDGVKCIRMMVSKFLLLCMVLGFQHRSMAVSLPFIVHRLFAGTNIPEAAAVAYIQWRFALDAIVFQETVDFGDADVDGLSGLDEIERLGSHLQRCMNDLSHLLHDNNDDINGELYSRHQLHLFFECTVRFNHR